MAGVKEGAMIGEGGRREKEEGGGGTRFGWVGVIN